jgi:hypothetical protein
MQKMYGYHKYNVYKMQVLIGAHRVLAQMTFRPYFLALAKSGALSRSQLH